MEPLTILDAMELFDVMNSTVSAWRPVMVSIDRSTGGSSYWGLGRLLVNHTVELICDVQGELGDQPIAQAVRQGECPPLDLPCRASTIALARTDGIVWLPCANAIRLRGLPPNPRRAAREREEAYR
jgi:hypothetical protein